METNQLIKDCLEKVCATNPDDRQKHLIYRKLGIKYNVDKCPHALITIQIDEIKLDDREKVKIVDLHSLLSNYSWFKNNIYYLSYEYFSKEYPEGGNLHIHLVIKYETGKLIKSKVIRDVQRRFKELAKTINVQTSSSKDHYDNRVNYIIGQKSKDMFQELDCVWRTQNNIEPYYTNA